jgi:hypothetical protein
LGKHRVNDECPRRNCGEYKADNQKAAIPFQVVPKPSNLRHTDPLFDVYYFLPEGMGVFWDMLLSYILWFFIAMV